MILECPILKPKFLQVKMTCLSKVLSSKAEKMYSLRHRWLHLSGNEFQELEVGNRDNKWENNTQDGSIPEDDLFETLYKNENDEIEMNEGGSCFDVM